MYAYAFTETSKSALLELGLSLRQYHNDIVLTGGWAPYFLTKNYFPHCGSMDIDLALKTEIMPKYDNILEIIEGLGYVATRSPFRFSRVINSHVDGKDYQIYLDLLCEKEGTVYLGNLHEVQENLHAFVFDGLSLAFDFNFEQEIETVLPGNGKDKTTMKVVDLAGSLALKGRAFVDRKSEKDSYDIFALTHYNGGPVQAADYFNQCVSGKQTSEANDDLLKKSIEYIKYGFQDENRRGPFFVESFSESAYKRNIVAAQVNQFLRHIK
jgi:predicted nucleotidyltransferase component of viral defense system